MPWKDCQVVWSEKQDRELEVVLGDDTKIDSLSDEYAVEFDFAPKWAESIGQALYYGMKTERQPGVILILEKPKSDRKFLERLNAVADDYGIQVWAMTEKELR